ncbi:hypothetical protein EVJ58_g10565 [Rhodofomes roseus]|uniref:Uncharacterized protein n=1 Tax=Rhodofomes roseus TaxID=34475 RepID=A0A4Y9XNX3_9APHY|nr:hypothetical protein EVJ58_g10565 [Rhodofomes roseus]
MLPLDAMPAVIFEENMDYIAGLGPFESAEDMQQVQDVALGDVVVEEPGDMHIVTMDGHNAFMDVPELSTAGVPTSTAHAGATNPENGMHNPWAISGGNPFLGGMTHWYPPGPSGVNGPTVTNGSFNQPQLLPPPVMNPQMYMMMMMMMANGGMPPYLTQGFNPLPGNQLGGMSLGQPTALGSDQVTSGGPQSWGTFTGNALPGSTHGHGVPQGMTDVHMAQMG